MTLSKKQKLIKAVNEGLIIRAVYRDEEKGLAVRFLEPFVLGRTLANNAAIRAFQRRGFSESGNRRAWKLFLISRFHKITLTKRRFTTRDLYNPQDRGMKSIEATFGSNKGSLNAALNNLVDKFLEKIGRE